MKSIEQLIRENKPELSDNEVKDLLEKADKYAGDKLQFFQDNGIDAIEYFRQKYLVGGYRVTFEEDDNSVFMGDVDEYFDDEE